MAYDEDLAERVRGELGGVKRTSERQMFGGVAFMVAGNMACGIVGDDLLVRVGADLHHDALTRPHVREMDFTGRPMKGMVYVGPEGVDADEDLRMWVKLGVAYATSLPAKGKKAPARRKAAPVKKTAAPATKKVVAKKKR